MAKRELPPRANRGKKPAHLLQIDDERPKMNKKLLSQLFCNTQEFKKKQRQNQRKNTMQANLKKYPFCRAVHFFFQLDNFQRIQTQSSYAICPKNIFNFTYSKDEIKIKETRIGDLINRDLIGLPAKPIEIKKPNEGAKNICYGYLYETEDKKYNIDKILYNYKILSKRLLKLEKKDLQKFGFLKRDKELADILSSEIDVNDKIQYLREKMWQLEQRKNSNVLGWQYEDNCYFYHSLDDKLHRSLSRAKEEISISHIYNSLIQLKDQEISTKNVSRNIQTYFEQIFYEKTAISCISSLCICQISQIEAIRRKALNSRIIFPFKIINFGKSQLLEIVNESLAIKFHNNNEINFYLAKNIWKRIFKTDLVLNRKIKILNYEQFLRKGKRCVQDIRKNRQSFLEHYSKSRLFQFDYLDKEINLNQLSAAGTASLSLFSQKQAIQISFKQYLIIMIYHQVCLSFTDIAYFIKFDPSILEIIGSEYFPKFCHIFSSAIGTFQAGMISGSIEILADCITKAQNFLPLNTILLFKYNEQKNIGMIWKKQQTIQQNWIEQNKEELSNFGQPYKRVKKF